MRCDSAGSLLVLSAPSMVAPPRNNASISTAAMPAVGENFDAVLA